MREASGPGGVEGGMEGGVEAGIEGGMEGGMEAQASSLNCFSDIFVQVG